MYAKNYDELSSWIIFIVSKFLASTTISSHFTTGYIDIYLRTLFLLSIPSFGILLCQAPVHIVITLARLGTSKKIGTRNYGWLYLR